MLQLGNWLKCYLSFYKVNFLGQTKSSGVEAALIWIDVTWTPAYGSPGLHNDHSCEKWQSFQTFLNSRIILWYDNKLTSLEATLVQNYDRSTHRPKTHRKTDGGEV